MAEEQTAYVITNAGHNIITRILMGLNVTFSKIAIGDGYENDTASFATKTELINEVLSLDIKSVQMPNLDTIELSAEFTKSDVQAEFWFREIGVYIIDPDDETKEILFAYGNKNNTAEYVTKHVQNYDLLKTIKCEIYVGSNANVNVIIKNTDGVGTYNFFMDNWAIRGYGEPYTINLGNLGDVFQVFQKTGNSLFETGMVDITKDAANNTILKSLTPFDGCVYYL